MPAAHCISSLQGVILYADQGFLDLLQRTADEVIGISYRQITDPRDLQRSADMLLALEERAAPIRLQKRYLRPDGSSIAANLLITRFSSPDRLVSTLFWRDNGRELPPARLWQAALRIRHVHDKRIALFGADLGTDPIGLLLICIYLAEAEGRNVGLSDIAAYAAIAPSTAIRWVKALQKQGVLAFKIDPSIDIQLTHAGLEKVEALLTAVYELSDEAAMLD